MMRSVPPLIEYTFGGSAARVEFAAAAVGVQDHMV